MEVADRCHRAYLHDLKDTSHTVHSAVEVLIRGLTSPIKSIERVTELARGAVTQHTSNVENIFLTILAADTAPEKFDISLQIKQCVHFLRQDALNHGIEMVLRLCDAGFIEAKVMKMRLVLLALLTDAIDAVASGASILVTTQIEDDKVVITMRDNRPVYNEVTQEEILLELNAKSVPLRAALTPPVVKHLVATMRGEITHHATPQGLTVSITFLQAARPLVSQ